MPGVQPLPVTVTCTGVVLAMVVSGLKFAVTVFGASIVTATPGLKSPIQLPVSAELISRIWRLLRAARRSRLSSIHPRCLWIRSCGRYCAEQLMLG